MLHMSAASSDVAALRFQVKQVCDGGFGSRSDLSRLTVTHNASMVVALSRCLVAGERCG